MFPSLILYNYLLVISYIDKEEQVLPSIFFYFSRRMISKSSRNACHSSFEA